MRIDSTWETVSKQGDPETWNLLTNPDAEQLSDETDGNSNEELANETRKLIRKSTVNLFPTCLHNSFM